MTEDEVFEQLVNTNWNAQEMQGAEDEVKCEAFDLIRDQHRKALSRKDVTIRLPITWTVDGDMVEIDEATAATMCDAMEQTFGWYQPRMTMEHLTTVIEGLVKTAPMTEGVVEDLRMRLVTTSAAWGSAGQTFAMQQAATFLLFEVGLLSADRLMDLMSTAMAELMKKVGTSELAEDVYGGIYKAHTMDEARSQIIKTLELTRQELAESGITWCDGDLEDDEKLVLIMDQVQEDLFKRAQDERDERGDR